MTIFKPYRRIIMGIPSQLELFQPITASFYVVARDFGFAPNPFWGWCTLATCKPEMRRKSNVGDYIIGLSSVAGNQDKNRKIVYVMLVEEILSFDKYWCDPRFLWKRPRFNASKAEVYGDNIYHRENGDWVQEKSHHSQFDGSEYLPCKFNTENDTSADCVLISSNFVYWGGNPITLPKCIDQKKVNNFSRGHCNRSDFFSCPDEFVKWFNSLSQKGRIEMPKSFNSAVKHELGSKSRMQRRVNKMTKAKYSDLICKDMSEFVIRDQVSPLSWDAYVNHVKETNKFESMGKILQLKYGLFGEIGSVLTGCKKFARDQNDYPKYQQDLLENIGDALWYLVAYGSVSAFDMAGLSKLYNERFTDSSASEPDVASLQKLAGTIGNFLTLEKDEDEKTKYNEVIEHYIRFISNSKLNFRYILFKNYEKTAGVFLHYNAFEFENFDHECPEDERFPKILEFEIFKRSNGKVYLKHHEMFVGDPLSDNIADKDAYAFHDIL
ncbi:MAG: hypothetical protein ORO03_08200, partial [Alphaproteobacteria bacterium]|nr:hypothetical protein [Alphaproteobacteria bacterium]